MVWRGRVTRKPLLGGGDLIFKRRFEIFKKRGGGSTGKGWRKNKRGWDPQRNYAYVPYNSAKKLLRMIIFSCRYKKKKDQTLIAHYILQSQRQICVNVPHWILQLLNLKLEWLKQNNNQILTVLLINLNTQQMQIGLPIKFYI